MNLFAHLTLGRGIAIATGTMLAIAFLTGNNDNLLVVDEEEELRLAMIGNSLMFYNDLPKLLEAMSSGKLYQDSCLRGGATLSRLLVYGNGMYAKWNTGMARVWDLESTDTYAAATEAFQEYMESAYPDGNDNYNNDDDNNDDDGYNYQLDTDYSHIYDFGACTVRQLLFGVDERFEELYEIGDNDNRRQRRQRRRRIEEQRQIEQNPKQSLQKLGDGKNNALIPVAEGAHHRLEDAADVDDANYNVDDAPVDDDTNDDQQLNYYTDDDYYLENYPLKDNGKNPCYQSPSYYFYKQSQYDAYNGGVPKWDYILLNDMTRAPCCTSPRAESLQILEDVYVTWIRKTGAVPVFMVSYAYWRTWKDMSGLTDIPTFTSLTYEGYREYAEAIGKLLPDDQQPKLAPVGLAFLLVWEENPTFWNSLIHMDDLHPSPTGTFLQGLVVYGTIYGHLPDPNVVLAGDTSSLWNKARMMTPPDDYREPYPTRDDAQYLYNIASRIIDGEFPKSFIHYTNGESANLDD